MIARALLLLALCALGGCVDGHVQSPLHVAGDRAGDILGMWRWMLGILGAVYLLVIGIATVALLRRRRGRDSEPRRVNLRTWVGIGGLALPITVLTFLLFLTLRGLAAEGRADRADADLTITVIAKQWWWDVQYHHPEPHARVKTANEIHVPVGRTVRIELKSHDVIHSFWVPALDGKIDMIPGRTNTMTFRAEEPGVYRGQCAEYCGMQHANMAFLVIAQDSADFEEWYLRELEPAATPATALALEGMDVFLKKPCALCHTVRGTGAHGQVGPELTHLASRRTLAGGTIPNTRGHLGGWITNPQAIKPGSHMPNIDLSAQELHALLAFLESLR